MITESRHYYESTERRDFTEDVTFPSLFSQSANEHRACGCTGRGQKKRSRQARGNTNTKQKRKQTKTLRMISTAYNNVAACKNLWATIVFVVKRWKHSPEDYAYQNVRQRPSKVSGACCCCTDDDGAAACLTNMHGLESERGSEFLCEREREEWREAALISSAPRFSSSPTGLSFFSSNYISSKFRWEFKNLSFPFVKAITWDEICRRRESIDAYSPIDALGTENRLPFRSRSSTIGVHQPLIRWARSRRRQRSGTFSAKRARFRTFKTNLGNQS